jgi:hypothetical protein
MAKVYRAIRGCQVRRTEEETLGVTGVHEKKQCLNSASKDPGTKIMMDAMRNYSCATRK